MTQRSRPLHWTTRDTADPLLLAPDALKLIWGVGAAPLPWHHVRLPISTAFQTATDFSQIKGHEYARRALEVAAAGGHSVLISGPPGSGKTLLARALPGILPPLCNEEAQEVALIYGIAGLFTLGDDLINRRPFRSPNCAVSRADLIGCWEIPLPREVILAHRGVLLLDELTEFDPGVLTALRRPLDEKVVTISGAWGRFTCPCNFTLVATMRPCPCGYHGDLGRECTCSPSEVFQHRRSVDCLLLDRIDVFVEVTRVEHEKLMSPSPGESSLQIRERVQRARELQRRRFRGSGTGTNAEMMPQEVVEHCKLEDEAHRLLQTANERLHLSTRAFYRLLKLSRTIADLADVETIRVFHLAEALQYRPPAPCRSADGLRASLWT